jgi:hypothetical protein
MMTNIIAFLHTTAAYQTAALQLMVGQANLAAKQLDLKESLPIVVPADTNQSEVMPPPMGIGGMILTSNYDFEFSGGYLTGISKKDWLKKVSPPVTNTLELANQPSLLDTNNAYQLATQWLTKISMDVPKLERKFPPRIFQPASRPRDTNGIFLAGVTNATSIPLYLIGWGDPLEGFLRTNRLGRPLPPRRPNALDAVYVQILGTTKELLSLHIRDTNFFTQPPLILTNAGELLGPLPPPRHFVEQMLGGKDAYETVVNPDKVEAWLLNSSYGGDEIVAKTNRTSAVRLKPAAAKQFSDILLNFDSYAWGMYKMCIPDYGVRLRFTRGSDTIEFLLCYECNILEASHNGQVQTQEMSFDSVHGKLVRAIQSVFPIDEAIKNLKAKEN